MKQLEHPNQPQEEILSETKESPLLSSEAQETEEQKEQEKKEKRKNEQKEIEALTRLLKEENSSEENLSAPEEIKESVASSEKKESILKTFIRRSLTALGFGAVILSTPDDAQGQSKTPNLSRSIVGVNPSRMTKTEVSKENITSYETSSKTLKGLTFYKGGKTLEGSITPTGKLNSFEHNEYGITEEDAYVIAEKHGFRTTNEKDFQTDLLNYIQKNDPKLIKEVLTKFGQTNAGTLYDGILGARTMYLLKIFKEKEMQGESKAEIVIKKNKDSLPPIEIPPEKEIPPSLQNFDECYIFFDISPSMKVNQKKLAEELRSMQREKPVTIVGFTDKADTTFSAKNTQEAADTLESIRLIDQNTELAIDVVLQTLPEKQFSLENKNLIIVSTDEALQGITKEKLELLKNLAKEKSLVFEFRMLVRDRHVMYSLDQVMDIYKKNYENNIMNKIKEIEQGITIRNKQLKEFEGQIKTATGKSKRQLQEMIEQTKEELVHFYHRLNEKRKTTITGYENEQKK